MRASVMVPKMCANYEPSAPGLFAGLDDYDDLPWPALAETDVYPELQGTFFLRPPHLDVFDQHYDEAVPELEILSGTFGLMPWWTREPAMARRTYNARTETVSKKPAHRDAWARGQHCLIPVKAFFEPDWRSGKSVRTRFELVDGGPMMIAGLWDRSKPGVTEIFSFTMLTINADNHPLLRNYHKVGAEKRIIVVLPRPQWREWLDAPPERSMDFMNQYPADRLIATPAPPAPKAKNAAIRDKSTFAVGARGPGLFA